MYARIARGAAGGNDSEDLWIESRSERFCRWTWCDFFFASFSYTTPRIGYSQLATTSNHQSSRFIQRSSVVSKSTPQHFAHDVFGRDVIKAFSFREWCGRNLWKNPIVRVMKNQSCPQQSTPSHCRQRKKPAREVRAMIRQAREKFLRLQVNSLRKEWIGEERLSQKRTIQ